MNERDLRSAVLVLDYRVDDAELRWSFVEGQLPRLAGIGAHHVVFYVSIQEQNRVMATIGVRQHGPVTELLRSPALFEWFNVSGVNDLPAIFAGEIVEKIDLVDGEADDTATGVIVGAVSTVGDVSELMTKVHSGLERFQNAGVRQLRVYRAFDNEQEVMTLMEVGSVAAAQRWIDHPDAAAEWMSRAGAGPYPSPFVGKLTHVISIEETP
jgi:hypothetical protein